MGNQTVGYRIMEETLENISSSIKTNKKNQIYLAVEWPYRLFGNLIILGFIFALSLVIVVIRTDLVQNKFRIITHDFYNYTNKLGFTIDDIIIEGRQRSTQKEIIDSLEVGGDSNILEINLSDIKKRVESLPWVKKATIGRTFLPNTLHIKITEKEISALWQSDKKLHPMDMDGSVIPINFKPTNPILIITGSKAPENFKEFFHIIKKDESIFKRIKAASFVSERRWNLILDNVETGILIKLPEEDMEVAWKKLLKLHTTQSLLKRKLTIIDLRLPNKVTVELGKSVPKKANKESKI